MWLDLVTDDVREWGMMSVILKKTRVNDFADIVRQNTPGKECINIKQKFITCFDLYISLCRLIRSIPEFTLFCSCLLFRQLFGWSVGPLVYLSWFPKRAEVTLSSLLLNHLLWAWFSRDLIIFNVNRLTFTFTLNIYS